MKKLLVIFTLTCSLAGALYAAEDSNISLNRFKDPSSVSYSLDFSKQLLNAVTCNDLLKARLLFKERLNISELLNNNEFTCDALLDVDVQDSNGFTPFHHAVRKNNLDLVKLLLEHKADPNKKNLWGYTPLHFALADERTKCAALLLVHGAIADTTITQNTSRQLNVAATLNQAIREIIFDSSDYLDSKTKRSLNRQRYNKGDLKFALNSLVFGPDYENLEKVYIWNENVQLPINIEGNKEKLPSFLPTSMLKNVKEGETLIINIPHNEDEDYYALKACQKEYNKKIKGETKPDSFELALSQKLQNKNREPIPQKIMDQIIDKEKRLAYTFHEIIKPKNSTTNGMYTTFGVFALLGLAWYCNPGSTLDIFKSFFSNLWQRRIEN